MLSSNQEANVELALKIADKLSADEKIVINKFSNIIREYKNLTGQEKKTNPNNDQFNSFIKRKSLKHYFDGKESFESYLESFGLKINVEMRTSAENRSYLTKIDLIRTNVNGKNEIIVSYDNVRQGQILREFTKFLNRNNKKIDAKEKDKQTSNNPKSSQTSNSTKNKTPLSVHINAHGPLQKKQKQDHNISQTALQVPLAHEINYYDPQDHIQGLTHPLQTANLSVNERFNVISNFQSLEMNRENRQVINPQNMLIQPIINQNFQSKEKKSNFLEQYCGDDIERYDFPIESSDHSQIIRSDQFQVTSQQVMPSSHYIPHHQQYLGQEYYQQQAVPSQFSNPASTNYSNHPASNNLDDLWNYTSQLSNELSQKHYHDAYKLFPSATPRNYSAQENFETLSNYSKSLNQELMQQYQTLQQQPIEIDDNDFPPQQSEFLETCLSNPSDYTLRNFVIEEPPSPAQTNVPPRIYPHNYSLFSNESNQPQATRHANDNSSERPSSYRPAGHGEG